MNPVSTNRIYKIRDSNTGLYSTGGHAPKWNLKGKTWNQVAHLKNHFRVWTTQCGWKRTNPLPIPENWEVVTFEISNNVSPNVYSAREFLKQ